MNIYLYTFGCKVNSYESSAMGQLLCAAGHTLVPDETQANVVVVNSCTVTAGGDRKVRQYLRRVRRLNPAAILVLTGCLPQAYPDIAAAIPEADIITGTGNRTALPALLENYLQSGARTLSIADNAQKVFEPLAAKEMDGHTRAFLKIEDGCDRYCNYCIIPHARGPVRSMPPEELQKQLELFAKNGYREVVLSGINLSFYGRDLGLTLPDAVAAACSVSGIARVRLGSLEPDLLSDAMLDALASNSKLCPHFHLALQSGCDDTLHRMNRHYTAAQFAAVAEKIRARFSRPAFTTDVMVGYPGESEADFEKSLAFVANFGFLKCHVFPYSARPGTPAATLDAQIPRAEKERRARAMAAAAKKTREGVLQSFVGQSARVILEQTLGDGFEGYTDHYLPALVRGTGLQNGDIIAGVITVVENERCIIEL